jgi:multiple sugar transport system substrate-binding protein
VRLVVWESYDTAERRLFLAIRDRFVEERRRRGQDVVIDVSPVPYAGLLPKLKTACLTGTTPDICRVDCAHVVPMAYGNALWPLDEVAGLGADDLDRMRDEYVRAAIDSCLFTVRRKGTVRRHLFGLPDQTNCVVLFYNRALFAARARALAAEGLDPARPPRTWAELAACARVLTDPAAGVYGLALDNSLWWTLPFFHTYGAHVMRQNPDGTFACFLDEPDAVSAFTVRVNLSRVRHRFPGPAGERESPVEAGIWRPAALTKEQGFTTGRYAMVFSGPWSLDAFRRGGQGRLDFGVGPVPRGPAGTSSAVGGTNMVVFRSCREPRLAFDFLRYLTSEEVQREWCTRLGQIPVRSSLLETLDVRDPPQMATFFRQMASARARPPIPVYDRIEEIANAEMELALQGVKSPEEALRAAAARVERDVLPQLAGER